MADTERSVFEEDVLVTDDDELKRLLFAPAPAAPQPPLRHMRVFEVAYSGATLAEVLIGRRVLSLMVTAPPHTAAEPLALPPGTSADDLLVTHLEVDVANDGDGFSAEPIGALILAFQSLTALDLLLPCTDAGRRLLAILCSALQSPRAPALETLILGQPDLRKGCAAQFCKALRLRSCQSLTELRLFTCLGSDGDTAEVVRALKTTRTLTALSVFAADGGPLTATALVELLKDNDTLTDLRADCNETAASAVTSPFVALAETVRSNPRSALTAEPVVGRGDSVWCGGDPVADRLPARVGAVR
jgi:hypothetical protein